MSEKEVLDLARGLREVPVPAVDAGFNRRVRANLEPARPSLGSLWATCGPVLSIALVSFAATLALLKWSGSATSEAVSQSLSRSPSRPDAVLSFEIPSPRDASDVTGAESLLGLGSMRGHRLEIP